MSEVKKIATRESYGNALVELGAEHDNLIVLDADLAAATKTGVFKQAYPDRISYIHSRHPEALLVAIDASLGSRRHQGYITIGNGAIRPGAGAGKTLPEVGDIFITGIVNVSGSFEQLLLQTTRLATIFHMAESISQGILLACRELEAAGTSELLL